MPASALRSSNPDCRSKRVAEFEEADDAEIHWAGCYDGEGLLPHHLAVHRGELAFSFSEMASPDSMES